MASAKKSAQLKGAPTKVLLGVLMLVLPAIAYFAVFHNEIQSDIDAARAKKQNLDQELRLALEAEKSYQKELEELGERERRRAELIKILPVTTEYPAFLASVQNVANLVGVELIAWTPQEEVQEQFYARVPMRIELSGRYHRLAKFFYNVGQVERIINMEDISLGKPEVRDGDIYLRASVMATAFHAVDESLAAPADGSNRRRSRRK